MPSVTITDLPDTTHRAISEQAALHGRSIEDEIRTILNGFAAPQRTVKLGSLLAEIGREVNLSEEEFAIFSGVRGKSQARAAEFE